MIELRQIDGSVIDLSFSAKFVEHYNKPNSFAKQVIEKEINAGLWYDDILFNLPHDSIIIDAGANCGLWSMYMQPKAQRIYCIEPTPIFCDTLATLLNPVVTKIFPFALWNHTGEVHLNQVADNSTCNNTANGKGTPCATLLHFITKYKIDHVDLLKLDIEGAETQVIIEDEPSGEALKRCRIVYIEVHPPPYGNADEKAIIEKMISLGFTHKKGARELSHYFINGH